MKKCHKIFLSILFCFLVAMPFATSFLWQGNSIETSEENIEVVAPKVENITDANDKEDTEETTTGDTPTYKSYDDYFADLNITKETITEKDFTGDGSASDPYVVHSTRGFLYLTNNSLSGISLWSKYIELDCDIILNDEKFDENGNVLQSNDGGIVYKWGGIKMEKSHLDGRNHTIFGLFTRFDYGGLVGYNNRETVSSIKNVKMANVYRKGQNGGAFAWMAGNIENCHILSGFVYTTYGGAFAGSVSTMSNCSNYAYVIGNGSVGSFAESVGNAYRCINYGTLNNVGNSWVGGLFKRATTISDCINYGDITSVGTYVGGLVCEVFNFIAKNCINYGKITSYTRPSAFVNRCSSSAKFIDCKNYGHTLATRDNSTGCQLVWWRANSSIRIEAINCIFDTGESVEGLFTGEGVAKEIVLERCVININSSLSKSVSLISGANKFVIKSLSVNVRGEKVKPFLFTTSATTTSKFVIGDILINSNYSTKYNYLFSTALTNPDLEIQGAIVNNQSANKNYYGSDFSGFYVSWKTSKLGLTALDGKGLFQNTLKEERLQNEGYIDMTPNADEKYVQLEYLQGTGTQWIDIGYTPNIDTRIDAEIAVTGNTNNAMGYNYKAASGNVSFGASGANLCATFGATTDKTVLRIPFDTEFHSYSISKAKVQIDAQSLVPTHTTDMKFLKFNLFYYNTNWGGTYIASGMKIKSFKIYENEKIIMDLIPVKRYDGVIGMYDKYNNKFYTNSGTGDFVAGPKIV